MHGRQRVIAVGVAIVLLAAVVIAVMRRDDSELRITGTSTTTTLQTSTTLAATTTSTSTSTTTTSSSTTTSAPTTTAGPTTTGPPETVPDTVPGRGLTLADASVTLTPVATINRPIAGAVWPGNAAALYIATRTGYLYVMQGGVSGPLLDISQETTPTGERGLLGVAFSPDGGWLAVSFTNLDGDNQLDLFAMNANGTVNVGARRNLLIVPHPTYANHNGGGVLYGPDGYLWWGLGDGGGAGDPFNNAQNLSTLRGKLVRVDPSSGAASIADYGLRNPWRFSFDRATNDLYIGDVGQNSYEEIDWLPAGVTGANFGWNLREGFHSYNGGAPPPGNVDPIFEYPHTDGRCSITGGYVYRGSRIPALWGAYLFADYCGGQVHALTNESGTVTLERDLGVNGGNVASFAEDAAGELYVLSFPSTVYRVDPA